MVSCDSCIWGFSWLVLAWPQDNDSVVRSQKRLSTIELVSHVLQLGLVCDKHSEETMALLGDSSDLALSSACSKASQLVL